MTVITGVVNIASAGRESVVRDRRFRQRTTRELRPVGGTLPQYSSVVSIGAIGIVIILGIAVATGVGRFVVDRWRGNGQRIQPLVKILLGWVGIARRNGCPVGCGREACSGRFVSRRSLLRVETICAHKSRFRILTRIGQLRWVRMVLARIRS